MKLLFNQEERDLLRRVEAEERGLPVEAHGLYLKWQELKVCRDISKLFGFEKLLSWINNQ